MVEFDRRRKKSPLVMARKMKQAVEDEEDGFIAGQVVSVSWEVLGESIKFELGFHEMSMDSPFTFRGSKDIQSYDRGAERRIATPPEGVSQEVGEYSEFFALAFDLEWEFAELEAASIGGSGLLTDFEFGYEAMGAKSEVLDSDLDSVSGAR